MRLASPTFIDKTGYIRGQNIDTVFQALHESLRLLRGTLGEELYATLSEMSDRMRAYFVADPENKTGETRKGRQIIDEMSDLLIQSIRKARQPSSP